MRKLWLILPFVLFTTLIFAFESDRWGRSAVTSASVTDSCSQVRSEIDDSIVVFADTMEANPVLINDLKVIDSMRVPLWISAPATGAVGMLGVDSAQDSLFVYFPGGKTAIYPQVSAGVMTGGDIQDSLNNATRSITQTWEWDGGNIIAADGQKFIATDDTEEDSFSIYDAGDTTHITSDNPIRIGGEGTTTNDSTETELLRVIGATDSVIIVPTSVTADSLFGIIDTTETDFTTYVGNHAGAGGGADDWVTLMAIPIWYGGNGDFQCDATKHYYVSNATTEDMWSQGFSLPIEDDGTDVVIDSMIVPVKIFNAANDSVMMVLQEVQDPQTFADIDSQLVVSAGGVWQNINLIPNGDITPTDNYGYRIHADGHNTSSSSIRLGCYIRVVYHK